jgi:glucans biosynthesis protein C
METQSTRLYYIDWLRVLAFTLLFVFHAWRPFDHFEWHIKNAIQSNFFDYLTFFIHGWRMDLIFLVSGVGTWFAMNSRKSLFLTDRLKRLIVPFIFGIILIIPPQKYLEGISFHGYEGNYFEFLIDWPVIAFSRNFGASILLWFGHLGAHIYYLPYLFVMTIPVVFLYKWMKRKNLSFSRLNNIILTPWGIFLLILAILVSRFALKPLFPYYTDWADFFTYLWMFVYGFVFIRNPKFVELVKKQMWLFLNLGILASVLLMYFVSSSPENLQLYSRAGYSLIHLYLNFLAVMISFSWVMFFVALSAKRLNFSHQTLQPFNNAILPVYILHQTLIIVLGYYVIQWNMAVALKFIIIATAAISTSVIMYMYIRKVNVLRVLFGMKSQNWPPNKANSPFTDNNF